MGDVARLAGVSVQTVSRVATGSEHVRPETREKVLRAMNKLGYSPNRAAQALRRGSFKTIGVLTQQIQRTGEALTTAGVLEAATAADYAVNLVQVERPVSDDLRQAVYRLSHQAIDGLVVVQAGRAGSEHLVLPPSMPVAVSDSTLVDHYPSASADQVGGVRDAVEHLLGLGHRSIQHVCGPGDSQSSLIRRATWARCLREAGLLDALRAEPWLASPWFQKRHRSHVFDAELLVDQEAVPVGERGTACGSRDVPASFDPRRRDYDFRQVERLMTRVSTRKTDTHDPMLVLEEANQCF